LVRRSPFVRVRAAPRKRWEVKTEHCGKTVIIWEKKTFFSRSKKEVRFG